MKKQVVTFGCMLMCIFALLTGCGTLQKEASNKTISYANQYIDLHIHLDGAITVDIAKKLSELQNISLPTDDDTELKRLLTVQEDCKNLNDFLKCFDLPVSLMQTYEGLKEAAYLVANDMKTQGVVYAEIRYAPHHLEATPFRYFL